MISFLELQSRMLRDKKAREEYEDLDFIRQLTRVRMRSGMSQSQLAEIISTKQAVISRFECGKGNPTVSFVRKVVTMLGMKLEISILEDGIVHDIQVR